MIKWKTCLMFMIISYLFTQVPAIASSAKDSVHLVVNGVISDEDMAYIDNGITYIPFRAVFKQIGVPIEYDVNSHMISYTYQDEPYSIDITEEIIFTPDGGYVLLTPLLTLHQHTYIPEEYVEDLLLLEVNYDEENNKLIVNSPDYAYNSTINSLIKSYYDRDIPADQLFTFNVTPYGSPSDLYTLDTILARVQDTKIGTVKFESISEASVRTSQITTTPAVTRNKEVELHFRKEEDQWKISKINAIHYQITLLDDVDEKAAALLQNSPDEVEKLLNDLHADYEAQYGNDAEAAIKAYSPLFIEDWNEGNRIFTWESIIKEQIQNPVSQKNLLEAKVIYIDDQTAAVYVKVRFKELPQGESYEYEEVLYLDHTNGDRWTFYLSNPLDSNY